MEVPEHIWFLFSRNLSGEATSEENEMRVYVLHKCNSIIIQSKERVVLDISWTMMFTMVLKSKQMFD